MEINWGAFSFYNKIRYPTRMAHLDCPCKRRVVPESELSHSLSNLTFHRPSWHGEKNSCLSASSALILCLGFTIRHLSTRSNSDLGIRSKNSGLFVFCLHQSRSFIDGKNCTSKRSCNRKISSNKMK